MTWEEVNAAASDLANELVPERLAGTLIIVPVANRHAYVQHD